MLWNKRYWNDGKQGEKTVNLVLIEGNELVIRAEGCARYRIELKRMTTEREILGWVWHLTGKDWASRALIGQFIEVALRQIGIEADLWS